MITRGQGWVGGVGCDYKRKIQEILVIVKLFCILMFKHWYHGCDIIIVLQGVTIGGKWDLTLFLTTACESTSISQ